MIDHGKEPNGRGAVMLYWRCPQCYYENTFKPGSHKDPKVARKIKCLGCDEEFTPVRKENFLPDDKGGG
jgi:hypothetical protein